MKEDGGIIVAVALKSAHTSMAMDQLGAHVSKEAAHIITVDDNKLIYLFIK
jgi:hypothetical protein